MRVLAAVISRAFWFAVLFCFFVFIGFLGLTQLMSGTAMLIISLVGIVTGFALLRLVTAPISKPRKEKGRSVSRTGLNSQKR